MGSKPYLSFPPFRLDLGNEQLWCGSELVPLRPKPFALLRYLVEQAGRLVTKEELLKAVWPETYVSEGLLKGYIRDLRDVLGDDPQAPRFIETVMRRGYRFIAPLTAASPVSGSRFEVPRSTPAPSTQHPAPPLVGREPELAQLHEWLEKSCNGQREVVFVTGEPGIGKTTLVDAFLHHTAARGGLWVGRGQCIEHYGAGESYLPLLKAFGRLGREPGGGRLSALLTRHAPTWLLQMPALLGETDLETLQRKVQGVTRDRMLREFAELVEAMSAEQPLLLALEDLHWSDPSTLDALTLLAQRRDAARLLVLGTYRPAEVIVRGHPLRAIKQELHAHGQCEELTLGGLSEAAVAEYLARRFPGSTLPPQLARVIHRSTEGNPLFMVNVVDDLITRKVVREVEGHWQLRAAAEDVTVGIPENLRQLIERQIERLPRDEQRVLEAASVAGTIFSAAAVAAALDTEVTEVESRCEEFARCQQFIQRAGIEEWPDRTLTARYGFLHGLYQQLWQERVTPSQHQLFHLRIGQRKKAGYQGRVQEIAAELAVHFEQGRDFRRAVQYQRQAAENAIGRSAPQEALQLVTTALTLLKTLPETRERMEQELALQLALGTPLIALTGFAAPEVGAAYTRAQELCRQLGEPPQFFFVLLGLWVFHLVRGEMEIALSLGEQLSQLAQQGHDPTLLLHAHVALGTPLMFLGSLSSAAEHFAQGSALYDPHRHQTQISAYGLDPGVFCDSYTAFTLMCLGYPDQARQRSEEALALARSLGHPYTTACALTWAASVCQFRREIGPTQEHAEALITLSQAHGFPYWLAFGLLLRGWALSAQGNGAEGCEQISHGLATLQATQTRIGTQFGVTVLAEAYGKEGQVEEGLARVNEVLPTVDPRGERLWDAELYRLKGELILQQCKGAHPQSADRDPQVEAEECFHQALTIARRQQAKLWELRAAMSLSRLWARQGKRQQAWRILAEVYGWFTEGFDTADLQEAKALLAELM